MSKYSSVLLICSFLIAFVQAVPEGRIVGGEEAVEGQFPHQISLRRNDSHTCGGSIISRNYILTAAHCVTEIVGGVIRPISPKLYTVYTGSNNRFEGGVGIEVESITVHEEFRYRPVLANDVALLKLAEPLTFTKKIQPIQLARRETQEGSSVVISGWGDLKRFGDTPATLQWTVLSYITMDECRRINGISSNTVICLAHEEGKGACNGDSGGPATFNNELIGVCSFGIGGCGSIYPDGYTKVLYYLDWIQKNSDV